MRLDAEVARLDGVLIAEISATIGLHQISHEKYSVTESATRSSPDRR
jgi:hypothetical protein